MFLQRMQIAAANSLHQWHTVLQDDAVPRAWMATQGCPPDVTPEVAQLINNAGVGEVRRTALAEAFWTTYAPTIGAPTLTGARLLACAESTAKHVLKPCSVNCTSLTQLTQIKWPMSVIQRARISGAHTGYFDEVVCAWPWEPIDMQMVSDILPGTVVVLLEPGPEHVGWINWAGFKPSCQFYDEIEAALNQNGCALAPLTAAKKTPVVASYFGVEVKKSAEV